MERQVQNSAAIGRLCQRRFFPLRVGDGNDKVRHVRRDSRGFKAVQHEKTHVRVMISALCSMINALCGR